MSSATFRRSSIHNLNSPSSVSTAHATISPTDLEELKPSVRFSSEAIGLPEEKPLVSWKDMVALTFACICCIISFATVWIPWIAVRLGQITQLQVPGVMAALTFNALSREVGLVLLLLEARLGDSTLQSFDALIRNDVLAANLGIPFRLALLLLLAVPPSLNFLDKQFSYGTTSAGMKSKSMTFGTYTAPRLPPIGNGIALTVNAYTPFWIDPRVNETYGYNLAVVDNDTAALLDTPDQLGIAQIQSSLSLGESRTLSASVNAKVSTSIHVPQEGPFEDPTGMMVEGGAPEGGYWNITRYLQLGICSAAFTRPHDTLFFYAAIYPCSNESSATAYYPDQARPAMKGVQQTRQCFHGTWNITSTNITLISGMQLPKRVQSSCRNQSLLTDSHAAIDWMLPLITEFDWVWWPRTSNVNTLPALVAASTWARIVALEGLGLQHMSSYQLQTHQRFSQWRNILEHKKRSHEINETLKVITLQRSPGLAVLLLLQPILTFVALAGKVLFHSVPIGEDFGLISVVSGLNHNPVKLKMMRRAGLSGKLTRKVRMQFDVISAKDRDVGGDISVTLDGKGTSRSIEQKTIYG